VYKQQHAFNRTDKDLGYINHCMLLMLVQKHVFSQAPEAFNRTDKDLGYINLAKHLSTSYLQGHLTNLQNTCAALCSEGLKRAATAAVSWIPNKAMPPQRVQPSGPAVARGFLSKQSSGLESVQQTRKLCKHYSLNV